MELETNKNSLCLFVLMMFCFIIQTNGQNNSLLEDTCISDVCYFIHKRHSNGAIKEIGQSKDTNQKNGAWIYFNSDGSSNNLGKYKNNVKVGKWFYSNSIIIYNRRGKVIGRGKGCLNCPDF